MEMKMMRVTPPMAREWLKKNTANRRLRPSKVNGIKEMLMRGEYKTTHQGVAFADDGTLLDGQHRLHAVALMPDSFGITLPVFTGMKRETFDVIDTLLTPRSASDVLRKEQGLTAVARFMVCKLKDSAAKTSITPSMLRPFVEAIEPYYDALMDYCPTVSKTWSAASIRTAAILRMMEGGDRDYVLLSYHALNHQDFDGMSPIVRALFKQQIRGTINSQSLDIFARSYKAFDYTKHKTPTIQISDQSHLVNAAKASIDTYVLGQKKAAPSGAAKKVNAAKSTPRMMA